MPIVGRSLPFFFSLHALEELDRLLALAQPHVGLLPVGPLAHEAPLPAGLAMHQRHAHLGHLDLELRLDRPLDVDLVGPAVDLEGDDVLLVAQLGRLLGDQRTPDGLLDPPFAGTATSRLSAPSLTTKKGRATTS